ncbi:MAG TPA: ATP-binding protein [Leptolyngbyaceae cyanobacterium]
MPLPGGATDKFGNRYEVRWTVACMIEVMDENADSIRLEPPGVEGEGVEFWLSKGNSRGYHQVKRQQSVGNWTIVNLKNKEILSNFWKKLTKSSTAECVFISTDRAFQLDELADNAKRSASWQEFEREFLNSGKAQTSERLKNFQELCRCWNNCPETEAYEALQRISVRVMDEESLRTNIEGRIAALVEGESATVVDVLAQFALDEVHHELTAHDIWHHLEKKHRLRRRQWGKDPHVLTAVDDANNRYFSPLRDAAIANQVIPRDEAQTVLRKLAAPDTKRGLLLLGEAGVGKSGVMLQVLEALRDRGVPTLAFRIDRLEPTLLPNDVGQQLGLPGSPANVLAAVAQKRDCVLIIDQLDAVSLASGRNPQFFDCVAEIIKQTQAHPKMRVVLACRKFDLDNDHRLQCLTDINGIADTVTINRLPHPTVQKVVSELYLDAIRLNAKQLNLLSVPLHLSLLAEIVGDSTIDALDFGSAKDLYDKFWERKQNLLREHCGHSVEWTRVIDRLCDYISNRQTLSAPQEVLDDRADDAKAMASEHVLIWDSKRVSFFHEGFFDYAFARRFVAKGLKLLPFLTSSEQHLFRRAQVRQILLHQREADFEYYLDNLRELLTSSDIRFHLKQVIFALLAALNDPTEEEWKIIASLMGAQNNPLTQQVWGIFRRSVVWFQLLDSLGIIQQWLRNETEERIDQTVTLLSIMQRQIPDRISELVEPYIGVSEIWRNRLNELVQRAELTTGERFFKLFLRLIDEGILDQKKEIIDDTRDFWMRIYSLAQKRPKWACEAISHYLNRYLALSLATEEPNLFHRKSGTLPHSQFAKQVLTKSARNAPTTFIKYLLPFMLRVMEATALREGNLPWLDRVWAYRSPGEVHSIDDALLREMEVALSSLAKNQPEDFSFIVAEQLLRQSKFETVQYLLIHAYAANGEKFANEAAAYLCDQPTRLQTGYAICSVGSEGASFWATRQLLEAITPHCSNKHLAMLETTILNYYPESEKTAGMHSSYGHAQFVLLEGITSSRRSESVTRRLQEWQRKFGKESVKAPNPIEVSLVGPPIPESATQKMTDEQWLRAIQRYDRDSLGFNKDWSFAGGAGELSHLLEKQVKIEPKRFAALVSQFPDDTHPSYFEAVLRGIADISVDIEATIRLSEQLFAALVSQFPDNTHPIYVKAVLRSIADLDVNLEIDISLDIETDIGAVCQRCHQLPNHPCGRWISWLIGELADLPWSEEAFDIVTWYAVNDPDPEQEWWRTETSNGQVYWGGNIVDAGINSTRGSAVSAITKLILADKNRLSYFQLTLQQIVQDRSIAVRSCVAELLMVVLNYDRDLAVNLFQELCNTEDVLLGTETVEYFLYYALPTHFEALKSILERMVISESTEVAKIGARQACLTSLAIEEARWLSELCLSGTEAHRTAAAEIFVANFHTAGFREFCESALVQLFHDRSQEVRSQAAKCFFCFEGEQLGNYVSLIEAFVQSPAFTSNSYDLIHALEKTTAKLPDVTYQMCQQFLDGINSDEPSIRARTIAMADKVSLLLLRVYTQSKQEAMRSHCLDLIDRMAQIEVYGLDEALTQFER